MPRNPKLHGVIRITGLGIAMACASILPSGAGEPDLVTRIEKANEAYGKARNVADEAYRKELAEAIAGAGQVEVCLLEALVVDRVPEAGSDGDWVKRLPADRFPIFPYMGSVEILKRRLLIPGEIAALMPSLRSTIAITAEEEAKAGSALCHDPIHGLRVMEGDRVMFQTSVCYRCNNFSMIYPDGRAEFYALTSPEFRKVMELLMPIPGGEKKGE